ncbi:MAG: TRAP transporter large permease subunit, partial [Cetobacterium sp.]
FNLCIGNITPPVGNTLFVGVKVAKLKMEDVMKEMVKYYAVIIAVLLLVVYIPELSTALPKLMGLIK